MRVIVTGGSKGIGRAIAQAVVEAGGSVMITGRNPTHVADAVKALSHGQPEGRVAGAPADVRDRKAVDALVADAARRFGGLDVLVNNAGVGAFANVADQGDDDWHRVIETNLTGPFYCSRAVIPHLRAAGGGWIINIASLAGRHPFAGGAAYCASKAALIAFTESLMQEVRFEKIRVSVVLPGSVATEFDGPSQGAASDEWKLTGDDVAQVVMDLLRNPARSLPSRVEIRPSMPRKKA
jgi:NAD(P)-dependent dehydrogenase (short-subunit alcohol dehydrogenase family)